MLARHDGGGGGGGGAYLSIGFYESGDVEPRVPRSHVRPYARRLVYADTASGLRVVDGHSLVAGDEATVHRVRLLFFDECPQLVQASAALSLPPCPLPPSPRAQLPSFVRRRVSSGQQASAVRCCFPSPPKTTPDR